MSSPWTCVPAKNGETPFWYIPEVSISPLDLSDEVHRRKKLQQDHRRLPEIKFSSSPLEGLLESIQQAIINLVPMESQETRKFLLRKLKSIEMDLPDERLHLQNLRQSISQPAEAIQSPYLQHPWLLSYKAP